MFRFFIFLVFAFFSYVGFGHWYYWQTGDFRVENVLLASPLSAKVVSQKELKLVQQTLAQPFTYLGHGNQTYVFASADGKYVLKLFMKDYLTRTWLKHMFPPIFPFRSFLHYQGEKKTYRTERLINGYCFSYFYDPEDSGLVYLHLNPNISFEEMVLLDGLGRSIPFSIQSYLFALQERVVPSREEFLRLMAKGDLEGIKKRLRELFLLYCRQMQKGLYDDDHNLIDNTGFIADRAVRQDAGKVIYGEEYCNLEKIREELHSLMVHRLVPWFQRHNVPYIEELVLWMRKEISVLACS